MLSYLIDFFAGKMFVLCALKACFDLDLVGSFEFVIGVVMVQWFAFCGLSIGCL